MQNVITGPWTTPPVRKSWKRMSRHERRAFDQWLNWLIDDVLCVLSRLGRERSGASFGQQGSFGLISDAHYFCEEGLKEAERLRLNMYKIMPPLPDVWPDYFNLNMARGAIDSLSSAA